MTSTTGLFYELLSEKSKIKVTSKDQTHPVLWRLASKFLTILSFGKLTTFLTEYTTTVGRTIYFPVGWKVDEATGKDYEILRHELVHVTRMEKLGFNNIVLGTIVFVFLYFLIPFPIFFAWFRYWFEREAYKISWYVEQEQGLNPQIDDYVKQLTGPDYLWMWIFRNQVKKWFMKNCKVFKAS